MRLLLLLLIDKTWTVLLASWRVESAVELVLGAHDDRCGHLLWTVEIRHAKHISIRLLLLLHLLLLLLLTIILVVDKSGVAV